MNQCPHCNTNLEGSYVSVDMRKLQLNCPVCHKLIKLN